MEDTKFQCTKCGQIGSVGRCCGLDTRIPLNDAARAEIEALIKTPRTNEKTYAPDAGEFAFVDASFARQLETELAEARAEIERKDKIIKKMREASTYCDSLVKAEAEAAERGK